MTLTNEQQRRPRAAQRLSEKIADLAQARLADLPVEDLARLEDMLDRDPLAMRTAADIAVEHVLALGRRA